MSNRRITSSRLGASSSSSGSSGSGRSRRIRSDVGEEKDE